MFDIEWVLNKWKLFLLLLNSTECRKVYCIGIVHLISSLLVLLAQWFFTGHIGRCSWFFQRLKMETLSAPHSYCFLALTIDIWVWCLVRCSHSVTMRERPRERHSDPAIFQLPTSLPCEKKKSFVINWWQKWPQLSLFSVSTPFAIWLCSCSHQEVVSISPSH